MNIIKIGKKISYLLGATMLLMNAGCVKNDALVSPQEGTIYMPQAYQERGTLELYRIDSLQTSYFGAAYGGFNKAGSDIAVTFKVDTSLVAAYNEQNSYLGYSYTVLPDSAYTISGLETVIKAGSTNSDPLELSIRASKLAMGTRYMLPIRMASISSGIFDTSLSVTYYKIDTLTQRTRDVTLPATITVSNENGSGSTAAEGSTKLIDGDYTTKFYTGTFNAADFWLQLKLSASRAISAYTLTSGNDASERDPKSWKLLGSNDGNNWVTLDTRSDFLFSDRRQTVTFELNNPTGEAYSYYKLQISENNGGSNFQMTEWRLIQYY